MTERPSPAQERHASSYYGDRLPARRGHTRCSDCPAEFPTSGRKKRCGPCSDIHSQEMARARWRATRR